MHPVNCKCRPNPGTRPGKANTSSSPFLPAEADPGAGIATGGSLF